MKTQLTFTAATALVVGQLGAQARELPLKHAPVPTVAAITAEDLLTRLYIFADDSMQGRSVRRIGNVKGTDYIAGEMAKLGLEPAGDNGTYFQEVKFVATVMD